MEDSFGSGRRDGGAPPRCRSPENPFTAGGGRIGVTAGVFDDVGVAYAAVSFRLEDGAAFTEIPLHDDGGHGDGLAGDGVFGAVLPEFPSEVLRHPRPSRAAAPTRRRTGSIAGRSARAATLSPHLEYARGDAFREFMIAFRKAHPSIARPTFWREDVAWHGPDGPADWTHESRALAYFLRGESAGDDDLYVMINAHWEDREFAVCEGQPQEWHRVVDTARPSPDDIAEPGTERRLEAARYAVRARSVVVLRRERGRTALQPQR